MYFLEIVTVWLRHFWKDRRRHSGDNCARHCQQYAAVACFLENTEPTRSCWWIFGGVHLCLTNVWCHKCGVFSVCYISDLPFSKSLRAPILYANRKQNGRLWKCATSVIRASVRLRPTRSHPLQWSQCTQTQKIRVTTQNYSLQMCSTATIICCEFRKSYAKRLELHSDRRLIERLFWGGVLESDS